MEKNSSQSDRSRYVFIDALRGIACLGVLLHHMLHNSVMEETLHGILPGFIIWMSDYGAYGVQVFFVLSGFVIAHSLRDNPLTRQSLGNFVLRRQIRLDPPYWLMIVVALCLHQIELAMPALKTSPMPGLSEVILNLFYLQKVAGVEGVVGVAWTLCIEIQFYLVFISLLVMGNVAVKSVTKSQTNHATVALIYTTGALSLAVIHFGSYPVWFFQYWFYFAAGVLCYWSVRKLINEWVFFSFVMLFLVSSLSSFAGNVTERNVSGPAMMVGLLTVTTIYGVGRKDHLTDWWNSSVLQYLGRISYSLYLVHLTVLTTVLRAAYKVTGNNEQMAVVWFVVAGLISIGVAHLFFVAVEQPSMRLAAMLKQSRTSQTDSRKVAEAESGTPLPEVREIESTPRFPQERRAHLRLQDQ